MLHGMLRPPSRSIKATLSVKQCQHHGKIAPLRLLTSQPPPCNIILRLLMWDRAALESGPSCTRCFAGSGAMLVPPFFCILRGMVGYGHNTISPLEKSESKISLSFRWSRRYHSPGKPDYVKSSFRGRASISLPYCLSGT